MTHQRGDKLMTPKEVGAAFNVDPKTVTRWARAGKIPSIKTLGGHRRYRETVVQELLRERVENEADNEKDPDS